MQPKHSKKLETFGNTANAFKQKEQIIDEDSEHEEELFATPTMLEKPEKKDSKPKIDPLTMLRQSFSQRKSTLFNAGSEQKQMSESDSSKDIVLKSPGQSSSDAASPEKRITQRDNIMNRNRISELKLTSLSERKSLRRELKNQTEGRPAFVNNFIAKSKLEAKCTEIVSKEISKYDKLSMFTSLIVNMLQSIDDNENTQLE